MAWRRAVASGLAAGRRVRRVVVNPSDDSAFVKSVERLSREPAMSPSALQARLRDSYPHAVARRRDIAAELQDVWYVYRDGRWTALGQTNVINEERERGRPVDRDGRVARRERPRRARRGQRSEARRERSSDV